MTAIGLITCAKAHLRTTRARLRLAADAITGRLDSQMLDAQETAIATAKANLRAMGFDPTMHVSKQMGWFYELQTDAAREAAIRLLDTAAESWALEGLQVARSFTIQQPVYTASGVILEARTYTVKGIVPADLLDSEQVKPGMMFRA